MPESDGVFRIAQGLRESRQTRWPSSDPDRRGHEGIEMVTFGHSVDDYAPAAHKFLQDRGISARVCGR